MRSRAAAGAVSLFALLLGACGGDTGGGAEERAPATSEPAPRVHADATQPAADVEALLERWVTSPNDADIPAVVAAGRPAIDRLVSWLAGEDDERRRDASYLLPYFGPDAVAPLAALLDGNADARTEVMYVLERMGDLCGDPEVAAPLWPPLLRHLGDRAVVANGSFVTGLAPTGTAFTGDLVALWLGPDRAAAKLAGEVLVAMGPAASPTAQAAIRVLQNPGADEDSTNQAYRVLESADSADRVLVDAVAGLLRAPSADLRARGAAVLEHLGDGAAPLAGELVRLVRDPDESVHFAALSTLWNNPSLAAEHAREIVDALSVGDEERMFLSCLLATPAVRDAIARVEPTLSGDVREFIRRELLATAPANSPELVAALKSAEPDERRLAIARLDEVDVPVTEADVGLLEDPDIGVRAFAVRVLALRQAAAAPRMRAAARSLLASEDPSDRSVGVTALANLSNDDVATLEEVIDALRSEDSSLRDAAASGLSRSSSPLGSHPDVVAALEAAIAGSESDQRQDEALGRTLLRFDGGTDAFLRATEVRLRRIATTGEVAIDGLFAVIRATGSAAERLRPVLERTEWANHVQADAARGVLGALAQDPVRIAMLSDLSEETVRRLLAMGAAGRAAVPLLVQRGDGNARTRLLDCLRGTDLTDAVLAASKRTDDAAADDPPPASAGASGGELPDSAHPGVTVHDEAGPPATATGESWRTGAALLAPLLPDERAVEVLDLLVGDRDIVVVRAAADSLLTVAARAPAAIPVPLVQRMLAGQLTCAEAAVRIAATIGPRGAPLVPVLRELRERHFFEFRKLSFRDINLRAAAAIRCITGDDEELRSALLRELAQAGMPSDDDFPAAAVEEWLPAVAWSSGDIGLLLRAFQRCDRRERFAFVPAVKRLGPDAAAFVSGVAALIPAYTDIGDTESANQAALDALVSIGRAARPAIPSLRASMARNEIGRDVGAAAIRAIESAQR